MGAYHKRAIYYRIRYGLGAELEPPATQVMANTEHVLHGFLTRRRHRSRSELAQHPGEGEGTNTTPVHAWCPDLMPTGVAK